MKLMKKDNYSFNDLQNTTVINELNNILNDKSACKVLCSVDCNDVVTSMVQQAVEFKKENDLSVFHFEYVPTDTDQQAALDSDSNLSTLIVKEVTDTVGFISELVPVAGVVQRNDHPSIHVLFSTIGYENGKIYSSIDSELDQFMTMREYSRKKV